MVSASIRAFPDVTEQYILDRDASGTSIGAVFSKKINDKERMIAYASRTFCKAETRYCVTRRELLAVVHIMNIFDTTFLDDIFISGQTTYH